MIIFEHTVPCKNCSIIDVPLNAPSCNMGWICKRCLIKFPVLLKLAGKTQW